MKKLLLFSLLSAQLCQLQGMLVISTLKRCNNVPRGTFFTSIRPFSTTHQNNYSTLSQKCFDDIHAIKDDVILLTDTCKDIFSDMSALDNPHLRPSHVINWLKSDKKVDSKVPLRCLPLSKYIALVAKNDDDILDEIFLQQYKKTQDLKETWEWFFDFFADNTIRETLIHQIHNMMCMDLLEQQGFTLDAHGKVVVIDSPNTASSEDIKRTKHYTKMVTTPLSNDTICISESCYNTINIIKEDASKLKYYCKGIFLGIGERNRPNVKPSNIINWLQTDSLIDKDTQLKHVPASTYISRFIQKQNDTLDAAFNEKYNETQNVSETWKWFNDFFAENVLRRSINVYIQKLIACDFLNKSDVVLLDDGTIALDPSYKPESE